MKHRQRQPYMPEMTRAVSQIQVARAAQLIDSFFGGAHAPVDRAADVGFFAASGELGLLVEVGLGDFD